MSQLVSVIIPTFKRSSFLAKAIKSVNDQTYQNIEVIVVDDNTEISEIEKVKEVANNWNNVKYVKNNRTKGGCGARNTGILEAKGELIAFLDDDDIWLPEKLTLQVECINQCEDLILISCFYIKRTLKGKSKKVTKKPKTLSRKDIFRGKCPATTSLIMAKKEKLVSAGLFDESLPSFQDFDLWVRCLKFGRLQIVDEYLVEFVIHDGDRVSINLESRLEGLEYISRKWGDDIKFHYSLNAFKSKYKSIAYMENANSLFSSVFFNSLYYSIVYLMYSPYKLEAWKRILACFTKVFPLKLYKVQF